jgi:hypothetical protein
MLSPARALSLFVALALVASGGALAAVEFAGVAEYESTEGTVETKSIEPVPNRTAPSPVSVFREDSERLYHPNITYSYTVDGEQYTGEDVATGPQIIRDNRNATVAAVAAIDPGATNVYYDPDNPADAHLLQSLDFFPSGVLLMCGFLLVADTLTPGLRVVRPLSSRMPVESLERLPGVSEHEPFNDADNPPEILESRRTWAGTDRAPFEGRAAAAIWFFFLLCITDIVLIYYFLSSPPYDLWAAITALVVPVGLARLTFTQVLA